MPDLTRTCKDCQQLFLFTEGEQMFYADHGYQPPKRCQTCRAFQRAARQAREEATEFERRASTGLRPA